MGRKKIVITPLSNEKQRNITFNKRKNGLLKKAAELSLLCKLKLFLAFTDLNGNLINFYTPDSEFLNEFDFSKDDKTLITFTERDYPDFFKVNHYKKKSDASLSDKELSLHPSNPKPFFHFKKHKYIPKEFAPDLDSKDMKKLEENKEILYKESRLENQQKKPLKKQLTIKIPEKNKCLEFEMNVLKKVNTMNPDEFLSSTNIKDNESSSLKGTQMLSSLNEISLKNEPTGPLLSLEKKSLLSKNPEENQFLLALLSNNKNLQNLESAANHFYFPLANMPSKEGSIKDDLIRPLDSKNLRTDLATLNSRALNFNEFLQMFTINNSGGDDYLRFLNLNSSRMSAAGLNTGGRLGFGNLTSHGFNATNINQLINNEMDKEEKEKQQKEETQDEGDVLKKKRKLE